MTYIDFSQEKKKGRIFDSVIVVIDIRSLRCGIGIK